jgi:phage tail protein X
LSTYAELYRQDFPKGKPLGRPKLGAAKEIYLSTHVPPILKQTLEANKGIATLSQFVRALLIQWYNAQPGVEALPT